MPIWKSTPLLRVPSWEASSHRSFAIGRARDEADARATAAQAFDAKTRFTPAKGPKFPPWERSALVKAERIDVRRVVTLSLP